MPALSLSAQNGHIIDDAEYVLDELVTVHSPSIEGPLTSTHDGRYLYTAEGGVVAMIDADPAVSDDSNFSSPLWREQVCELGMTPIDMAVDPDMDLGAASAEETNAYIYIAGGRDGLWVMHAGREADAQPILGYRVDDSGNLNASTQNGRKWCNSVDFIEVGGVTYLLATFGKVNASRLRVYDLQEVRDIAALATAATGSETSPVLQVKLQRSAIGLGGTPPEGDSFSYGLAVDDAEDDVYAALGEHGLVKVHFNAPGGILNAGLAQDGPYFGTGSPYDDGRSLEGNRTLYGSTDYWMPAEGSTPTYLAYSHSPFFLDVAVENEGPGRHRLYAAVDHLGWCAFSLDATWDADIWSSPSVPATAPAGFPDFLQEGSRDRIGTQDKDQIRLINDTAVEAAYRHTTARHLDVVRTQPAGTSGEVHTALLVSLAPRRFVIDPARRNEGRILTYNLNLGPVPGDAYSLDMKGKGSYVLAYDLQGSYGTSQTAPAWNLPGKNFDGRTRAGYDLHVPEQQPDTELHFFVSGNVDETKINSALVGSATAGTYRSHHLLWAWYDDWPAVDPVTLHHDDSRVRDKFYRLGRLGLGVFPSRVDQDLLITTKNDGGFIPDGAPVFDPAANEVLTPMATPGFRTLDQTVDFELVPSLFRDQAIVSMPMAERLDYGVTTGANGGWVSNDGTHDWEYRMGWMFHFIDAGDNPLNASLGTRDLYNIRWVINKFRPLYNGPGGAISDIKLEQQLHLTPPPCKFSPLPYDDPLMGHDDPGLTVPPAGEDYKAYYQGQWAGRIYYGEPETFEDYNTYVQTYFGPDVDEKGILFAPLNGSPQGVWAYGLTHVEALLDGGAGTYQMNDLVQSAAQPNTLPGDHAKALGGLVTHPEYWNVPDVRLVSDVPDVVDGELFIQGMRGGVSGVPGTKAGPTGVHTWDLEMLELPNPDFIQGDPPHTETKWILAAACGEVSLHEDESAIMNSSWKPDVEFRSTAGYDHLLVRFFDVSDPMLLEGAISDLSHVAPGPNRDSGSLPGYTLIGPDAHTSASYVKWISMKDPLDQDRDFLLVTDLGGSVYLYDLADLLTVGVSGQHQGEDGEAQYGGFFKRATDPPTNTIPYKVHLTVSDNEHTAIFGCEVAQETWTDQSSTAQSVTYVYFGVPRLGVEVAKIVFPGGGTTPELEYVGRVQTPGNASRLHVETYPSGGSYPEALLFVADYEGGFRIYRHHMIPGGS